MSAKRRNRGLSTEDRALWEKVVENIAPRKAAMPPATIADLDIPEPRPLPTPKPLKPIAQGLKPKPASAAMQRPPTAPHNMDKNSFNRLKKGKIAVEGKIDLHGMTLAQAHPALIGFVREAHVSGKRLLLVITGKGKTRRDDGIMPERQGILRLQIPHWLTMPPLAPMVLQVTEAHLKHGGSGAFYVYLKRQR